MRNLMALASLSWLVGCGGGTADDKDGSDTDVLDTVVVDTDVPDTDVPDTDLVDTPVVDTPDTVADTDLADTVDTVPDTVVADADADGSPDADDCAPNDPTVSPGARETCDGLDNDCDPATPDAAGTASWTASGGQPVDVTDAFAAPAGAYTPWASPSSGALRFCPGTFATGVHVATGHEVTITGAGRDLTTLDARGRDRALTISGSAAATGLSLKGGDAAGGIAGPAARIDASASLILRDAIIADNVGSGGAGPFSGALLMEPNASLTVEDVIARDNTAFIASWQGGTLSLARTTISGGLTGFISGTVTLDEVVLQDVGEGFHLGAPGSFSATGSTFRRIGGFLIEDYSNYPFTFSMEGGSISDINGEVVNLHDASPATLQLVDVTVERSHNTSGVTPFFARDGVTLRGVTFDDVVTNGWAVVQAPWGVSVIEDSTFNGCSAAFNVVSLAGTSATVSNTTFSENAAAGNGGGALFIGATVNTIEASTFVHNTSVKGGAVLVGPFRGAQYSTTTISGSTFDRNVATVGDGGAIFAPWSALTISGCSFLGNSAAGAGGAVSVPLPPVIEDSAFTDNVAGTYGGAVVVENDGGGGGTVTGSTFLRNTSAVGAAYTYYLYGGLTLNQVDMGEGPDDNVPADVGAFDTSIAVELGSAYTGVCTNVCN